MCVYVLFSLLRVNTCFQFTIHLSTSTIRVYLLQTRVYVDIIRKISHVFLHSRILHVNAKCDDVYCISVGKIQQRVWIHFDSQGIVVVCLDYDCK